jgi:hypothetical protein
MDQVNLGEGFAAGSNEYNDEPSGLIKSEVVSWPAERLSAS